MNRLLVFAAVLVMASTSVASADPFVFSSFDPGDTLSSAVGVTGSNPENRDVGTPFTPDRTHRLQTIQIPLAWEGTGENRGDVWLMADNGGVPGAIIESFSAANLERNVGIAGPLVILTSTGKPLLHAQTPYWVVVSAEG